MSIRAIDIQTSVTGSQVVSNIRGNQQATEKIHQTIPEGEIRELEKKSHEEINSTGRGQSTSSEQNQNGSAQDHHYQHNPYLKKSQKNLDLIRGQQLDLVA